MKGRWAGFHSSCPSRLPNSEFVTRSLLSSPFAPLSFPSVPFFARTSTHLPHVCDSILLFPLFEISLLDARREWWGRSMGAIAATPFIGDADTDLVKKKSKRHPSCEARPSASIHTHGQCACKKQGKGNGSSFAAAVSSALKGQGSTSSNSGAPMGRPKDVWKRDVEYVRRILELLMRLPLESLDFATMAVRDELKAMMKEQGKVMMSAAGLKELVGDKLYNLFQCAVGMHLFHETALFGSCISAFRAHSFSASRTASPHHALARHPVSRSLLRAPHLSLSSAFRSAPAFSVECIPSPSISTQSRMVECSQFLPVLS
ncbi:hypothetical protein MSAN_00841600 [Mycena sanguinolenta]|uniref:Uncharacterized protein n=1 Tax=Mycena sanguinolenta TaxID=230812 RepID=A0A8H6Z1T9_9AGAR|nr:hypothetical protein MSAN_00841600 [Mycena sanguinolenta]